MSLGFLINIVLNSKVVEIKGLDSFGDHIFGHWKEFLRQVDSDGGFGFLARRNGILENLRYFYYYFWLV